MKTRILIVDDNEAIRKALKTLLETRADWEVCGQAQNGEEGVAKAAELKPDLIILDLVMPVMDGLQTARAIAKIWPATPILLHTQHYSPEIELEAKKFGIRHVVAKAHPAESLFKAMEALLSAGRVIPAPDSPVSTSLVSATIVEGASINTTSPNQTQSSDTSTRPTDAPMNGRKTE